MSQIAQSIDEVIRLGLADWMKAHGFKKSGRTWHKSQGDNWLIVNVQASQGNMGNEGKFAINLGVYATAIAALAGQKPLEGKPKEYESTVRKRLGVLAHGEDRWWSVTPDSDLNAISADVMEKMQLFGLPWLNAHTENWQISAALKDTPSLLSVCSAWVTGSREEAANRLKSAIAARPAAKSHFSAWALKNGVEL
ncbi:DUF4304 domain-containing protein [Ralstonia pseudosolanacearum]|uniref:DUF4304 domain-containing protein n=1 Tax=Ralstonia pseudosolanacearum TaxID=1310165 RepID=UPI0005C6341F|nr:DUF4304 domain-containing protein [Ralstonia pseudosolanacearum]ANH36439.1 hypothetical protein A3768_5665 [Ralstonia solanacearum]MCK4150483.1 DUF4304 domain-containing protein [Ralstonia pseudosolanacearum]BCL90033.1 hypothetical protein MAFF211471_51210 [Ralstonia solanacearum]BCN02597.1 hypothetical protein RPSA_51330 [Ralstonia solanacearum]